MDDMVGEDPFVAYRACESLGMCRYKFGPIVQLVC